MLTRSSYFQYIVCGSGDFSDFGVQTCTQRAVGFSNANQPLRVTNMHSRYHNFDGYFFKVILNNPPIQWQDNFPCHHKAFLLN